MNPSEKVPDGQVVPSMSTARVGSRTIALLASLTQVAAFAIKGGPELSWRPFAFALEFGACALIVLAAFRTRRRWPIVGLAVWHIVIAAMIWIAGLQRSCVDYLDKPGRCGVIEGPNGSTRTVSLLVLASGLALAVTNPRRPPP